MASNMPQMLPIDKVAHFDCIVAQIEQTFLQLIDQLISRKSFLLEKILQFREVFDSKETARVAALKELEKTQLHLQELSMKVNLNLPVHEQARIVYQQAKQQLSVPTPFPNLSFSCPNLSFVLSQISTFGEVEQLQAPDYLEKREPVIVMGKNGKGEKEIDGCGLTLDEQNHEVYIADFNNSRVQVISFQGEFLSKFGNEILDRPWGIAVTESHIYVTDTYLHKVFQFSKLSHKLTNTAGGKGSIKGQLAYPHGLSVDSNGDVYIADSLNNRVSVFDKQFQFQTFLGKGSLKYPHDVKLALDKVLVLDESPYCVHFFFRSGDLLTSCVSQGQGQECFVNSPFFFCLDAEQNIIFSDRRRNSIKIVANSGELLHTIGRKGNEKGEFDKPYGISISNSGIIFILSENLNYSLQCF